MSALNLDSVVLDRSVGLILDPSASAPWRSQRTSLSDTGRVNFTNWIGDRYDSLPAIDILNALQAEIEALRYRDRSFGPELRMNKAIYAVVQAHETVKHTRAQAEFMNKETLRAWEAESHLDGVPLIVSYDNNDVLILCAIARTCDVLPFNRAEAAE